MDGGCECGRVRYRIEGAPIFVNCCHCRQCQKLSGSAFALNAMIERSRGTVIAGADTIAPDSAEARCPDCRAFLWGTHRFFGDRILFLRVGTLDEGERLPPDAHFFVRSKHPWVTLPAGARRFDTLPQAGDPPLLGPEAAARVAAAGGARLAPEPTPG
jgi:hypothetical protein